MKASFLTVVILIILSGACYSQENDAEISEKVIKQSDLIFKSSVYDYGVMKKGDDGIAYFEFKNIGKEDITITNVKTSCGCAQGYWPEYAIKKKKKDRIKIVYDTETLGKFYKNVYVYTDRHEYPIKLEIKGDVKN